LGGKHPSAKPWKGQGPGVFELVEDFDGDTYRAVYTVRFREVVYVLHAFQKKSPNGIKTAQVAVDLVERRLIPFPREQSWRVSWIINDLQSGCTKCSGGNRMKVAQQDCEARYGKPKP
jgi:hypothetical protein